ncbi:MAG: hypothetical protein JWN75_845 [Candidatus Saccharibacteria bacterium]|nr:hypothetical protein [Candidatus Saccharibacteria bacterium]
MAKKTKRRAPFKTLSRRTRLVILPIFALIAVGALVLAVITIMVMPRVDQASQRGVGANGFRAYPEDGTTLNIDKVTSKNEVITSLGNKAKSVDDVSVSKVFNFDGNRGQTATFNFIRADGARSSVYVDMMLFKNVATMNDANILDGTGKAGTIQGHPAYYMHAQTIGSDREYRLLVVNGLKAYKFVVVQPVKSITISEVGALATARKIAAEAKL